MPSNDCPDRQRLAAYSQGKLSAAEAQSIRLHVGSCADCRLALGDLACAPPAQA